jgi:serine-type D-Ala-D-Ala carboxypeptidase
MVASFDRVAALVVDSLGAAPCAVAAASRGAGTAVRRDIGAWGALSREAGAPLVTHDTPFDLASVTKPFVAVSFARLAKRGKISLDERLGSVLPDLSNTPVGDCPLELLLAHRSGLAAHRQLYAPLMEGRPIDRQQAIIEACLSRPECEGERPTQGFPPTYSDMGYLLVGLAIEARTQTALDEVVRAEVTSPLGIDARVGSARQLASRDAGFLERVAPTEDVAFRGGVVRGIVHDENAWALSGSGLSGHAGLFGDAASVRTFGEAVLAALMQDDGWLGPRDIEPLVRERQGGTLRAGFDGRGVTPSSGSRLGPRAFGHLGFTGTSLWLDPDIGFVGVLLTNRVHPTREHIAIRAARPRAYDAMFDALEHPR